MKKRKVAVILVDRANYGRLKPVMQAIKDHPSLDMQVVCAGTMVLERFGSPTRIVQNDGFEINAEVFIELEGSTPTTMAKSVGFAVIEFSSEFQRLKPDLVLVIGDRYEALAATIAASYMNLCIAHIQGGEVSGSIDESARHCITKLAQFHFPSTQRAADYIERMGEDPQTIHMSGCPSGDIAFNLDRTLDPKIFNKGIGVQINPLQPYLLVVFHPVTTEYGLEKEEALTLLSVLHQVNHPTLWLWPNIDAGSDHVSKAIRSFRENKKPGWLSLIKNFTPEDYLRVLANARCAVGNSSSFVRDGSFLGTPVVLLGDRQKGREIAENCRPTRIEAKAILEAVKAQMDHGPYPPSELYGTGNASAMIADTLATLKPYIQKRIHYPEEVKNKA